MNERLLSGNFACRTNDGYVGGIRLWGICPLVAMAPRISDDHVNKPCGVADIDLAEDPDHLAAASRMRRFIKLGFEASDLKPLIRSQPSVATLSSHAG